MARPSLKSETFQTTLPRVGFHVPYHRYARPVPKFCPSQCASRAGKKAVRKFARQGSCEESYGIFGATPKRFWKFLKNKKIHIYIYIIYKKLGLGLGAWACGLGPGRTKRVDGDSSPPIVTRILSAESNFDRGKISRTYMDQK